MNSVLQFHFLCYPKNGLRPALQSTGRTERDGGEQRRGREAIERERRNETHEDETAEQRKGKKKKGGKRGRVKSLARSKVHRHEGTCVLYPPNIEHDMWFTKEMKGFWA